MICSASRASLGHRVIRGELRGRKTHQEEKAQASDLQIGTPPSSRLTALEITSLVFPGFTLKVLARLCCRQPRSSAKALSQGRKTTWERNLYARVILVTVAWPELPSTSFQRCTFGFFGLGWFSDTGFDPTSGVDSTRGAHNRSPRVAYSSNTHQTRSLATLLVTTLYFPFFSSRPSNVISVS